MNPGGPNRAYDISVTVLPATDLDAGGVAGAGATTTNSVVLLPPLVLEVTADVPPAEAGNEVDDNPSDGR